VQGGRSNLTYLVRDAAAQWVVRRPPLGHVLPTAHDMKREFRVISGLHTTAVPVPEALLLCEDKDILGAPFYVMEFVTGTPYRTAEELIALGPARTKAIADSLVDTLVDLHSVDPESVGLGDFGRPDGFLERQLRRWKKQLDGSRSRDLPGIDELHDRLAASVPESGAPSIIHGDYRLDNVLVDSDDRITAVLDWEMSTLGDPLMDLALLLVYWEQPGDGLRHQINVARSLTTGDGFWTREQLVSAYGQATARPLDHLHACLGLACLKLAVIMESIHYRHLAGQALDPLSAGLGDATPALLELGLAVAGGQGLAGLAA
jgi:aminoglycoside phosphotransferase (APT) family kinase protein